MADKRGWASSFAILVALNAILVILILWVIGDDAYRHSYWRSLGFTPSTTYSPFFFVTSAVKGTTYIQGQLTLDWAQLLGAILILIDALFLVGALRERGRSKMSKVQPSTS